MLQPPGFCVALPPSPTLSLSTATSAGGGSQGGPPCGGAGLSAGSSGGATQQAAGHPPGRPDGCGAPGSWQRSACPPSALPCGRHARLRTGTHCWAFCPTCLWCRALCALSMPEACKLCAQFSTGASAGRCPLSRPCVSCCCAPSSWHSSRLVLQPGPAPLPQLLSSQAYIGALSSRACRQLRLLPQSMGALSACCLGGCGPARLAAAACSDTEACDTCRSRWPACWSWRTWSAR